MGMQRDAIRNQLLQSRSYQRKTQLLNKVKTQNKWKQRMKRSPFTVNLVAEQERIEEETVARLRGEARRDAAFRKRREKVKNEIILRALSEAQHLEQLREEKRLI